MKHSLTAAVVVCSIVGTHVCNRAVALDTVTWGGGNGSWSDSNWTKNSVSGLTASSAMGDNTGGRGGMNIVIGGGALVDFDPNNGNTLLGDYDKSSVVDTADYVVWRKGGTLQNDPTPGVQPGDYTYWRARYGIAALGDFKPRMDQTPGGSITVKEGAVLTMDSHSDLDGRWSRVGLSMTFDNGTWRRTHSAPSDGGGQIFFGYKNELLANQQIDINVINGGRIENDGKMVFGTPDYFVSQGGDGGHSPGIKVHMTIDGGTLDLSGGGYPDYPFGLISGEMVFVYEYNEGVGPKNEDYRINFTGPGSITVDPHFDTNAGQYLGGIYVAKQDSSGAFSAQGGAPDLFTPIGYEDLWDLGILQANGLSGLTGATFGTYFSTTGTKFTEDYTLTSLIPAGSGSGLAGSTVPEPASFFLAALIGLAGGCMTRRR
jgi:hypothetical protein